MAVNPLANNAYSFVQKALDNMQNPGSASSSSGSGAVSGGFGDLVSQGLKGVVDNLHAAETHATNSISGTKSSLTDVVGAVNSADIALKSVVAIRDRVISAYQDIMKMPI